MATTTQTVKGADKTMANITQNSNNAPSLATVILSILESPTEQWLAQPKQTPIPAKIPRKEFTMSSQQNIWMPSWASIANSNIMHEQRFFN